MTEVTAIKDKIGKLLALGKSPNEEEAQLALTRARDLMAKYKIDEKDLAGSHKKQEPEMRYTQFTYTTLTDAWMEWLMQVIADNFRCRASVARASMKRRQVVFMGFPEDLDLAVTAFGYAVEAIHAGNERVRRAYKNGLITAKEARQCSNDYGYGFADGLDDAFEAQDEECTETALVLTVPQEVHAYAEAQITGRLRTSGRYNSQSLLYRDGQQAGRSFNCMAKALQ